MLQTHEFGSTHTFIYIKKKEGKKQLKILLYMLFFLQSSLEEHQLQLNSQSSTSMKSQNTNYVTQWCNGSAKSLQETVGNSRWV